MDSVHPPHVCGGYTMECAYRIALGHTGGTDTVPYSEQSSACCARRVYTWYNQCAMCDGAPAHRTRAPGWWHCLLSFVLGRWTGCVLEKRVASCLNHEDCIMHVNETSVPTTLYRRTRRRKSLDLYFLRYRTTPPRERRVSIALPLSEALVASPDDNKNGNLCRLCL